MRGGHTQSTGNAGIVTGLVPFEGDLGMFSRILLARTPRSPLLLAFSSPDCLELSFALVVSPGPLVFSGWVLWSCAGRPSLF